MKEKLTLYEIAVFYCQCTKSKSGRVIFSVYTNTLTLHIYQSNILFIVICEVDAGVAICFLDLLIGVFYNFKKKYSANNLVY